MVVVKRVKWRLVGGEGCAGRHLDVTPAHNTVQDACSLNGRQHHFPVLKTAFTRGGCITGAFSRLASGVCPCYQPAGSLRASYLCSVAHPCSSPWACPCTLLPCSSSSPATSTWPRSTLQSSAGRDRGSQADGCRGGLPLGSREDRHWSSPATCRLDALLLGGSAAPPGAVGVQPDVTP
jgi:hypothetical protein